MESGTRPAKHIYKERLYRHFGAVDIPDFSVDVGLTMPDQMKDNAPYECVGYTTADILTDIYKTPLDPDFSYAAARYIAGDGKEGTQGTSFHAGLQGAIAVGALKTIEATITSAKEGEQYISDWNHWLPFLKKDALAYAQNGLRNVLGYGDAFDAILSACYTSKIGISVGSPWFSEWTSNIDHGIVQLPHLNGQYPFWHNYAVKGKKTIDNVPYLLVKSWQGTRVGDNGWLYFSRETINAALSVEGSGALILNPSANRWISLLGIILQRFPAVAPLIPQLLAAHP